MDLGHSAENVYLQAYALKIGTCAIGAFSDQALKAAVGMTKDEEPLYIMPLGRIREDS
jgi:nitroreductase